MERYCAKFGCSVNCRASQPAFQPTSGGQKSSFEWVLKTGPFPLRNDVLGGRKAPNLTLGLFWGAAPQISAFFEGARNLPIVHY